MEFSRETKPDPLTGINKPYYNNAYPKTTIVFGFYPLRDPDPNTVASLPCRGWLTPPAPLGPAGLRKASGGLAPEGRDVGCSIIGKFTQGKKAGGKQLTQRPTRVSSNAWFATPAKAAL